jgi:hypothetical protein
LAARGCAKQGRCQRWKEELTSGPGLAVRERGEGRRSGPLRVRWAGREGKLGRLGRNGEGERKERVGGFVLSLFFQNLFKTPFQLFKLLNLNSFQILNTSSRFQSFQNILKTFKTSHKQTKPCIQIMMHKHLLLLNY